jgi:hypothetical protein
MSKRADRALIAAKRPAGARTLTSDRTSSFESLGDVVGDERAFSA